MDDRRANHQNPYKLRRHQPFDYIVPLKKYRACASCDIGSL